MKNRRSVWYHMGIISENQKGGLWLVSIKGVFIKGWVKKWNVCIQQYISSVPLQSPNASNLWYFPIYDKLYFKNLWQTPLSWRGLILVFHRKVTHLTEQKQLRNNQKSVLLILSNHTQYQLLRWLSMMHLVNHCFDANLLSNQNLYQSVCSTFLSSSQLNTWKSHIHCEFQVCDMQLYMPNLNVRWKNQRRVITH